MCCWLLTRKTQAHFTATSIDVEFLFNIYENNPTCYFQCFEKFCYLVTDGPGNLELADRNRKSITIKWNAPKAEFDFYFVSYYPESNQSMLISKR